MTSVDDAVSSARRYIEVRNYGRAEDVLRAALTQDPESTALLIELGRAQVGQGNHAEAARSAYAALAGAPEDWFAMQIYAQALDGLGRRQEAAWMAWRAVTIWPHGAVTHYEYARLLEKAGQSLAALAPVEEALRIDPNDADAHSLRGSILDSLGRRREAGTSYREALRLKPEHATAVHNLAITELNSGKVSSALGGLLGAARLDPHLGDLARRNVGVVLRKVLRWATWVALVVAFASAAVVAQHDEGTSSATPRVVAGVGTAVLLAILVWLLRAVPRRTWTSVLETRKPLRLRLIVVGCAVVVGLLAAADVMVPVVDVLPFYLIMALLVVILVGSRTGD